MKRLLGIRRMALPLTAGAALLLAGCAPSVVGKWEGKMEGTDQRGVSMELKPNGTFAQTVSVGSMTITGTGTYKIEGDKFIRKSLSTSIKGQNGQVITGHTSPDQLAQEPPTTVKIEGNTMTLDSGPSKMTLTRAKL